MAFVPILNEPQIIESKEEFRRICKIGKLFFFSRILQMRNVRCIFQDTLKSLIMNIILYNHDIKNNKSSTDIYTLKMGENDSYRSQIVTVTWGKYCHRCFFLQYKMVVFILNQKYSFLFNRNSIHLILKKTLRVMLIKNNKILSI